MGYIAMAFPTLYPTGTAENELEGYSQQNTSSTYLNTKMEFWMIHLLTLLHIEFSDVMTIYNIPNNKWKLYYFIHGTLNMIVGLTNIHFKLAHCVISLLFGNYHFVQVYSSDNIEFIQCTVWTLNFFCKQKYKANVSVPHAIPIV
jgi:hypothetical protein